MSSRHEYLEAVRKRYVKAKTKAEKSSLIDELTANLGYHRKHAIEVLRGSGLRGTRIAKSIRPLKYAEALPAAILVWEALDYPCAERLHPVLLPTAELLAAHGELILSPETRQALGAISRPTLARRMRGWSSPKAKRALIRHNTGLRTDVPMGRFAWNEARPGCSPTKTNCSSQSSSHPSSSTLTALTLLPLPLSG